MVQLMTKEVPLSERQDMILDWLRSKGHKTDMSNTEREIRGCRSKQYFDTLEKAAAQATKMKMKAYACLYCDGFHLTSQK